MGRTKEWLATAVFVAGPPSPAKDLFRSQNALVIRGSSVFNADDLRPFLDRIHSAQ